MQSDAGIDVRVIRAPTNFGNQGAMFFGLRRLDVGPDDILITFDCDGEDDVAAIPSILELSALNPGKMVLIERRASEGIDAVQSVLRLVQAPIPLLRSPDDRSEQLSPDAGRPGPGRSVFAARGGAFRLCHLEAPTAIRRDDEGSAGTVRWLQQPERVPCSSATGWSD